MAEDVAHTVLLVDAPVLAAPSGLREQAVKTTALTVRNRIRSMMGNLFLIVCSFHVGIISLVCGKGK